MEAVVDSLALTAYGKGVAVALHANILINAHSDHVSSALCHSISIQSTHTYIWAYVYKTDVIIGADTYVPCPLPISMYGLKVMLLFCKNSNVYKHVIEAFI